MKINRSIELKEIDKSAIKLKLNDFEKLALYVVYIYDWLGKMEKASPFCKHVKKKFINTIPPDLIDFD